MAALETQLSITVPNGAWLAAVAFTDALTAAPFIARLVFLKNLAAVPVDVRWDDASDAVIRLEPAGALGAVAQMDFNAHPIDNPSGVAVFGVGGAGTVDVEATDQITPFPPIP